MIPRRDTQGRFFPGPDPDRHLLSKAEKQKGYLVATRLKNLPSRLRAWLRKKIRPYDQTRAEQRNP